MVNTRILEKRLGWRSAEPGVDPAPPTRAIAHSPVLQGRVEPSSPSLRGPRRLAVEDAWAELPSLDRDPAEQIDRTGIVPAVGRGSAAGAAFEQLRAQLMRVIRQNGWRRIGVTSPMRGAGRSFVAAGLAASTARLDGVRVLLIDADLEAPGLAAVFGVEAPGPLESVLSGSKPAEEHLVRVGSSLAVALNATPVPDVAERMLAPDAILALRAMTDLLAPDVVLVDMPPLLGGAVAQTLFAQLDAVLLISDGMANSARDITDCERLLDGQVPILGVILNKSEDRDPRARRLG